MAVLRDPDEDEKPPEAAGKDTNSKKAKAYDSFAAIEEAKKRTDRGNQCAEQGWFVRV